ncbi:MAG TPA: polysaccharide deacetylase family protein, partial [Rhizomicrobium sp.]|nr:polysaccharide deacetylase family protein [Rhizomicrobium sp.]
MRTFATEAGAPKAGAIRAGAIAAGLVLGLLAPVLAGSAAPASGNKADAELALFQPRNIFKSGLPRSHTIALTFDDGPNANTEAVLDALRELNVKATFFILGDQARRHPALLKRIAAEGHLLANHSADHEQLTSRYDAEPRLLLDELRETDERIAPLMKPDDKLYFRAPYGSWRSTHAAILNKDRRLRNYVGPVYWDIGGQISMSRDGYVMSSADWECWRIGWKAQTCAKGYLREIRRKDGGVVLMHCIHLNSARLVRAVVPALLEEGYNFVRLDQMPEYRQYETPQDGNAGMAQAGDLKHLASLRIVK